MYMYYVSTLYCHTNLLYYLILRFHKEYKYTLESIASMNITSISLQSGETVTTTTTSLENREVLEAIMSDRTARHSLKELVDASKEQYVSIV